MVLTAAALASLAVVQPVRHSELQFVVTSDAHYGITRATFRGRRDVDAQVVNAALAATMNAVSSAQFPSDHGVGAGRRVGPVDFIVEAGDVTNREEDTDVLTVQAASASWNQFVHDYLDGLRLQDASGARAPVLVVPGNHEASNAVGFYTHMNPPTDPTPLVEIDNRMLRLQPPKTAATFEYQRDRTFFTRDFGGIHFVFLHVWPDSVMRARMEQDLQNVSAQTPVVIFTHDQPEVEAKHFVNPNGTHGLNSTDRFENLLADVFADGGTIDTPSLVEQAQLEEFLGRHRTDTAYFHGNSNWHQVYEWNGPSRSVRLHTVRVDSPMKGAVSALDETKLSFAIVTIDLAERTMSVRECLWNTDPVHAGTSVRWGETVTTTLEPPPSSPWH